MAAGLILSAEQPIFLAIAPLLVALASFGFAQKFQAIINQPQAKTNELVDSSPVFFWEYDVEARRITTVSGKSEKITGYAPREIRDMGLKRLVEATASFDSSSSAMRQFVDFVASAEQQTSVVTNMLTKSGEQRIFQHQLSRQGSKVSGVTSDVTQVRQATDDMSYNAEHDRLTNLANRSSLEAIVRELIEQDQEFNVLMLSINQFRQIYDTMGHQVGDAVLRQLAHRYRNGLAGAKLIARFASDKFVVVVEGAARGETMATAGELARLTETKLEVKGLQLAVIPTIGIASYPDHGATPETLLQRSEIAISQALKEAKKVTFYSQAPDSISVERLTLSAAISDGIDFGEFELWYQPKINLRTSAIAGAEGLARWRHPQKGILLPDDFLELVKLSGEYHRFTDLVIETGIEAVSVCAKAGHPIPISVNLAALSFLNKDLAAKISSTLKAHAVKPNMFTVEITESDLFDEQGKHADVFNELHELGLGISIDDFGTGHSSLTRLKELPVSELKLDQSFIKDLNNEPDDLIIVQNVIDLASSLGHSTIAEGVEDAEIIETLKRLGCMGVQGFFYAKPMPLSEFIEFVQEWPQGTQVDLTTSQTL